ncbi:hypothetical protein PVAND_011823 [Polypedilum vanderplanki]|uniref:PWWP domain-containing protein n=1 Tax=Polypedilum vanderplanki TaxID=319348 RepID=A0A9J6CKL3_POLVA|nr:hypothetical protein PVAND_011823 [Polypedilum vanderplanki]
MSQSHYKDGEIVWVKWGNSWWPGEVWGTNRVPEDILSSLRKPVIAFVKFLQEDSFEFVRSPNSISAYNCEKKMEYIKKGMDKYRSNNKTMLNFPADVVKAEKLTSGNPNILDSIEAKTFASSKTKLSLNTEVSASPDTTKKNQMSSSSSASTTKKSPGSYNSSVKVQNTASSIQKLNDKKLTCTMCNFSTDRMNLLMMHIKNHSLTILSRVNSLSSSSSETRKPIVSKNASKKSDAEDGIAEDVRKIKESMKELVEHQSQTPLVTKKSRTSALKKDEKITPKSKSQVTKRERKSNIKNIKEDISSLETSTTTTTAEVDDKSKSNDTLGLKNELLADWLDDEDIVVNKMEEEKLLVTPTSIIETETSTGESSRSIRNIPKKQRVSEVYIQPQSTKELNSNIEKSSFEICSSVDNEDVKKIQKNSKRKRVSSDYIIEPERKKLLEEKVDSKLLMATAELLNETEVPNSSNNKITQSPSTFQKSNDIDKRYLPPKERNKRIFRVQRNSPDLTVQHNTLVSGEKVEEKNGKDKSIEEMESKNIVDNDDPKLHVQPSSIASKTELILPHKKKQSSRLLTEIEKHTSPVRETRNNRETPKFEQTFTNVRNKRYRKSNDFQNLNDSNLSIDNPAKVSVEESTSIFSSQNPLRETKDISDEIINSVNFTRDLKRQRSCDSPVNELKLEAKRLRKSNSPQPHPKSIVVACASEAICITSKGTISVARRDSIKTTCANSVVVTSHVIISEALSKQPIVTSIISTTDTTASPKKSISPSVSLPSQQQIPKNVLKIPKENIEEMKKQGLVTVENNRTKLTPKGRQKFKEFQDEQSSTGSISSSTTSSYSSSVSQTSVSKSIDSHEFTKLDENSIINDDKLMPNKTEVLLESKVAITTEQDVEKNEMQKTKEEEVKVIKEICEQDENDNETNQNEATKQIVESTFEEKEVKNENDSIVSETEMSDSVIIDKQNESTKLNEKENGNDNSANEEKEKDKDVDVDMETPIEDANSGGAGLIALQAETFGGPPNCFYLCRPVEGGYEPVDNQILVLNAQNALVPYDGEIVTETVQENLSAYSQLSPNSNIIINTPNGQKIELSHYAIMALQEQADENGIASVELSGEQLELNINGILEAIQSQQQDSNESGEVLSAVLIGEGSDVPLIIESSELPVEVQVRDPSVATQVSETLSKPIMSTTIAPEIAVNSSKTTITESVSKNLNIEDSLASIGVKTAQRANVPKSLELPITVTNPTIAETVNHRKLTTSILGNEAVSESFVVQHADNGSVED